MSVRRLYAASESTKYDSDHAVITIAFGSSVYSHALLRIMPAIFWSSPWSRTSVRDGPWYISAQKSDVLRTCAILKTTGPISVLFISRSLHQLVNYRIDLRCDRIRSVSYVYAYNYSGIIKIISKLWLHWLREPGPAFNMCDWCSEKIHWLWMSRFLIVVQQIIPTGYTINRAWISLTAHHT